MVGTKAILVSVLFWSAELCNRHFEELESLGQMNNSLNFDQLKRKVKRAVAKTQSSQHSLNNDDGHGRVRRQSAGQLFRFRTKTLGCGKFSASYTTVRTMEEV